MLSDWRNRIEFIRERFKRYKAVLVWLMIDLWRFGRQRLLIVLVGSFVSKSLLSSVFVILFLFLKAFESGTASWLKYLPDGLVVTDLFWPVAIIGSAFFICSSLLDFVVLKQIIDISARHSVDTSRRCLSTFFPILANIDGINAHPFPKDTVWLSTNGTDSLIRATRTLLRSVPMVFQLLYAALLLAIIDPLTVCTVILITIPGLGFSYIINARTLKNEHEIPELHRERRKFTIAQARQLAMKGLSPNEKVTLNLIDECPSFMESAVLRSDRVLNRQRSKTLTNLIVGVALLFVMIQLGYGALTGEREWTVVISFIALLRFAGASLGNILSTLTFISRLYPVLRRFPLYLRDFDNFTYSEIRTQKVNNSMGIGDLEKIRIATDKIYHIYTNVPLTSLNLWFFVNCVSNNKFLRAKALMDRALFLGSEAAFEKIDHKDQVGKAGFVFLRSGLWHHIGEKAQQTFGGSTLIVCHGNVQNKKIISDTWIVPTLAGRIGLFSSDWFYKHLDDINEILARTKMRSQENAEEDDEDDE